MPRGRRASPSSSASSSAAHLGDSARARRSRGRALVVLPTLVMFASPRRGVLLASSAGAVFATLYVAARAARRSSGFARSAGSPCSSSSPIVWAGDSAAYYAGRRWGKRKLAPVVSPKKTWEGLWGQIVAGLAVGALAGFLLAEGSRPLPGSAGAVPGRAIAVGALLGILVSVVAVVGDLVESTFKRSVAVKDSGGLLPGHGGLLDRLDSLALRFAGAAPRPHLPARGRRDDREEAHRAPRRHGLDRRFGALGRRATSRSASRSSRCRPGSNLDKLLPAIAALRPEGRLREDARGRGARAAGVPGRLASASASRGSWTSRRIPRPTSSSAGSSGRRASSRRTRP